MRLIRLKIICLAVAAVLHIFCIAQNNMKASVLKAAAAQQDFDMLRKALEEAHGGLYRFSSKADINQKFSTYRKRIDHDFTQSEFISLLSEMLAGLRDGHMRLEYDPETALALSNAKLFPFAVLIEGSKLKILYNESTEDSTISAGMEVISINGNNTQQLIPQLLQKIPGDGFIETGKARQLERNFSQRYWLFKDRSGEFTIVIKTSTGELLNKKIKGVLVADRQKNRTKNSANKQILQSMNLLAPAKENISLRYLNNRSVGLISIRSFEGQNFIPTLDSIFLELKTNKVKSLILDLRDNGGGVDNYGANLVSHFVNKPFRYFDRIHLPTINPSFTTYVPGTYTDLKNGTVPDPKGGYFVTEKLHTGVGIQNPFHSPFTGSLIVLLNGGTFSTAADVTATLHNLKRAVFIGEESGGGYNGNTSGLNALLKLPNSKLNLKIHLYEYFNAVTNPEKGRGTVPEYFIERKVIDLLQAKDKPLEKARQLLMRAGN